jgi:hypothetical protein
MLLKEKLSQILEEKEKIEAEVVNELTGEKKKN